MPHITVKLWPGKSEKQKRLLADAITRNVCEVLKYGEESVSVSVEEIEAKDWSEKVFGPDIIGNQKNLYKKPGYSREDL